MQISNIFKGTEDMSYKIKLIQVSNLIADLMNGMDEKSAY